jgi:UDP-N-acetylglucosamine 2-epimerase (non-hydrolysing)
MYLITYGTRPELIKLFPLINKMKKLGIEHKTLFTGQHRDLILEFENLTDKPDFVLENIMEHGQSINALVSKIINQSDEIIRKLDCKVIVQGDAASTFAIAFSGFNNNKEVVHLEAGLRTYNIESPFPEEGFRKMISQISTTHLCPTSRSVDNLKNEKILENVYLVGNTIVDSCEYILNNEKTSTKLKNLVQKNLSYYLCTLHRRENINNFKQMWSQLNDISKNKTILYVKHPSVPEARDYLSKNIIQLDPLSYQDMIYAINYSDGIISDSGGLQEEAICLEKKILICRDTSERPETIESGYGLLVGAEIKKNIEFLQNKSEKTIINNPYGANVIDKVIDVLID